MKGFTLLELLIVIGILIIASALSLPFFSSFQSQKDLASYNTFFAQTMRSAQTNAINGFHGSSWGVYIDDVNKQFVLYCGSNYASRQTDLDLATNYNSSFTLTSNFGNEINFSLYSGLPLVNGTTTMSDLTSLQNKFNTISPLGLISNF